MNKRYMDKRYIDKRYMDKRYMNKRYMNKRYVNKRYINKRYMNKRYMNKRYLNKRYINKRYRNKCYRNKRLYPEWPHNQGGCLACWRLLGRFSAESALIYTMHKALRGYCSWGCGCDQSIGSTVSDAIVRSVVDCN